MCSMVLDGGQMLGTLGIGVAGSADEIRAVRTQVVNDRPPQTNAVCGWCRSRLSCRSTRPSVAGTAAVFSSVGWRAHVSDSQGPSRSLCWCRYHGRRVLWEKLLQQLRDGESGARYNRQALAPPGWPEGGLTFSWLACEARSWNAGQREQGNRSRAGSFAG